MTSPQGSSLQEMSKKEANFPKRIFIFTYARTIFEYKCLLTKKFYRVNHKRIDVIYYSRKPYIHAQANCLFIFTFSSIILARCGVTILRRGYFRLRCCIGCKRMAASFHCHLTPSHGWTGGKHQFPSVRGQPTINWNPIYQLLVARNKPTNCATYPVFI